MFDPSDLSTIDWLNERALCDALQCQGQDHSELESSDLHEKIVHVCGFYKPNDIQPVFQGICQDAGRNWRTLNIKKHKTTKKLASEFASSCVDIVNTRTDCSVPGNIIIPKENQNGRQTRKFNLVHCFTKKKGSTLTVFYLQNVNSFEHSHFKGVIDLSHDLEVSVVCDADHDNDGEEEEL